MDEQVIQVEGDLDGSRLSLMRNFENYNQLFEFEVFNNSTGLSELDNCFWIKSYSKNRTTSRVIAINDNDDLILEDQVALKSNQDYNVLIQKLKLQLWTAEQVMQRPFRCNLLENRMKTLQTQYYEVQENIESEISKYNSNKNNKTNKFNLEDININSIDDSTVDWVDFNK